jgi:hypothetical protein
MRFLEILVEALSWLAIFIAPTMIGLVIGVYLYFKTGNYTLTLIPAVIGVVTGVLFAERIRRKYGCSNFFGRLRG